MQKLFNLNWRRIIFSGLIIVIVLAMMICCQMPGSSNKTTTKKDAVEKTATIDATITECHSGGSSSNLGIGESDLTETRTYNVVTKGVIRTLIKRGYKSSTDINTTTTGPWQVNVLTVYPSIYTGKIKTRLCGGFVTTTATVLSEAASQNAYAAVNGSYFILTPYWGSVGASMSMFAVNGEITNECINPRGGLYIPNDKKAFGIKIGRFTSTHIAVSSDGSYIKLNGLNRKPGIKDGVIENYTPAHDTITKFADEIVLYKPIFGTLSESTNGQGNNIGVEALINSRGVVTDVYTTLGHTIPTGGSILAGIGTGAAWITEHAQVGKRIKVFDSVTFEGRPLKLAPNSYMISTGPCLVKNGVRTTSEYWAEEGFTNAGFIGRNPRTLVGTKADGTLLIVLIDGRAIDVSVGATFDECATIMLSLGAKDVLNLDGGRSSVMVVNGSVVSNILESRAVGDILELIP